MMNKLTIVFPSKNKYTITHSYTSEYLQYLSDLGNTVVEIPSFEDIFKDVILNRNCTPWIGNDKIEKYAMQGIGYFNCKELLKEFYELRKERRRKEIRKDVENFFEGIIQPEGDMVRNINLHKLSWEKLCNNPTLSEQFFERHIEHVHWDKLLCNPSISEQFYEKYIKDKRWYIFLRNCNVSEQFIEKYFEYIDKKWFFTTYKISDKFINENEGKINWGFLSRNKTVDDEFCKRYINKIHIDDMIFNPSITEEFFRYYFSTHDSYKDREIWTGFSGLLHRTLSHEFIEEFFVPYHGNYRQNVNIVKQLNDLFSQITKEECNIIFENPTIPLRVIMFETLPLHILEYCAENFPEKMNWDRISSNPNITELFCEKYIDYFTYLSYKNENITEKFYEKYPDKVDWVRIRNATNVSPAFYTKHIDKITFNECYTPQDLEEIFASQEPSVASNTFTHYIERVIKDEFTLKF